MSDHSTLTPCKGLKRSGEPCRSTVVRDSGFCHVHDPSTTPEMKSAMGRAGAATVNSRSSRRALERDIARAQSQQAAAGAAIAEKDQALVGVAPALAPLNINTPAAVEATILKTITAIWDGTLPPARARAINDLLGTRLKLADLELTKVVLDLKAKLDARDQGRRPGRKNIPTPRFR